MPVMIHSSISQSLTYHLLPHSYYGHEIILDSMVNSFSGAPKPILDPLLMLKQPPQYPSSVMQWLFCLFLPWTANRVANPVLQIQPTSHSCCPVSTLVSPLYHNPWFCHQCPWCAHHCHSFIILSCHLITTASTFFISVWHSTGINYKTISEKKISSLGWT